MEENKAIKQRIKDLEDVCDGSCFSDEVDERNNLISNLQDQHQQDLYQNKRFDNDNSCAVWTVFNT